ncbi:MAG TPA: PSD1 and planctomycete cytochrome C domain-containing protein [Isosphaeraceae bacterium]|nr:PSD1 and planctomycete cytochrome C domain-containing protein [Isosphaeraceae bacterium]
MRISLACAAGLCLSGWLAIADDATGAAKAEPRMQRTSASTEHAAFFEARIRPILAEHCIRCHGPKKQESGLRLDSREGVLKGNDAGPVVVPGRPEESPLVAAIHYDATVKMPPRAKLPQQAIADLTAWVALGVPWPEDAPPSAATTPGESTDAAIAAIARRHWAFRPIRDASPPAVQDSAWPRTSVDRFILAKLEARGLVPAPAADRRTLIRRATFDLTGLPPSPADVAAFEADSSPGAYERLIDRLLASPRYGERWGRYWLDVARYADTKGYVFFQDADFHWAYTYRDYVIAAFNRDLAYDRFLVEQLAGDQLPPRPGGDKSPLTALGFLTLGGRFMGNFHDVIDDRIDVVCRGLMSLTVTCARCHDHKFDPIPTRDYYSLYGVLASAREPMIPPEAAASPHTAAYEKFVQELGVRQRRLAEFVTAKHRELIETAKRRAGEYLLAAQQALDQPSTEDFMLIADGTDLNPAMVVRWQSYLSRTRRDRDPVFAPWHALASLPEHDFAARSAEVIARFAAAATGGSSGGGSAGPRVNPVVARALAEGAPRSLAEVARIYGRVLNAVEALWQDAARRAALEGREPGPLPLPALEALRQVFHGADSPPAVPMDPFGELALLPDRPSQAKLQELRKAVQAWLTGGPGAPARAMSLEESPAPVEPRVFLRGNPHNLGEPVPRRFLAALAGPRRAPFRDGSGRLELARAIASRDNPLTARALVNRVWMHHLGTPLVATPGDFGLRSQPPTHPELLDHLAAQFLKDGWSIKALHRRILLSAVYQQRSDDRAEARAVDPENALYWRMNRRRLDFEATRDALLAVSGRLDSRIGGPPMPSLTGPGANRRTVYGFIDRLNLPGLYRTFDFPDPNATSPRRDQTTVAPQALFLMNHPFAVDAARALIARPEVAAARDPDDKVNQLYRLIYGRAPGVDEVAMAREFLAGSAVGTDSWRALAQALLMANEFVFVD